MINLNNIKRNQEVFVIDAWNNVNRCTIIDINYEHQDYIKVKFIEIIDTNGNKITEVYGEGHCKITDVFLAYSDAWNDLNIRENERYNNYLLEIKTMKDLLEFPLNHSFNDEDGCRDGLIVAAYKTKAKEILGLELG